MRPYILTAGDALTLASLSVTLSTPDTPSLSRILTQAFTVDRYPKKLGLFYYSIRKRVGPASLTGSNAFRN